MKPEELAQWVINNRYPKSENDKISDFEMFHFIVEESKRLDGVVSLPSQKLYTKEEVEKLLEAQKDFCADEVIQDADLIELSGISEQTFAIIRKVIKDSPSVLALSEAFNTIFQFNTKEL